MVLNKVRDAIAPLMNSLGLALARARISPDVVTMFGFMLAILAGYLYAAFPARPYFAALALVLSGLMDILDGAVARATNHVSRAGSFNDSTLDRLAEVAIYAGIIYAAYTSSVLVLLTLGFSLLVSYTRAKGDSLNITLSGIGIGERAERLLVLIIFSAIGFVAYGIYVVLALALVTFIQRYAFIIQKLR